MTLKTEVLDK